MGLHAYRELKNDPQQFAANLDMLGNKLRSICFCNNGNSSEQSTLGSVGSELKGNAMEIGMQLQHLETTGFDGNQETFSRVEQHSPLLSVEDGTAKARVGI